MITIRCQLTYSFDHSSSAIILTTYSFKLCSLSIDLRAMTIAGQVLMACAKNAKMGPFTATSGLV